MCNKIGKINKKNIFIIIFLLVICVGIIFFVAFHSKEGKETKDDIKTEQDNIKDDANGNVDAKDDQEDTDSDGLTVHQPGEINPDNSSDASGSWDETTESVDKNDSTGGNQSGNDNDSEQDEEDKEDILEDDVTWGDIY